ncbi:MAG TPA: GNAT family N-acetyltransferase, partial [bacterium]|nr:GNAT family N-acetyltransferase [bacterium]
NHPSIIMWVPFNEGWGQYDTERIVGLVRIFPLDLRQGPVRLKAAGIGGVATRPELRGRGFMTRLMERALERMRGDGYPVSVLWGDRFRYRRFGYEQAGRTLSLRLTARSLKAAGVTPAPVRRYLGEPGWLDQVRAAYEKHPFRLRRRPGDYRLIFEKPGLFLFGGGRGQDFGYLAVTGRGAWQPVEFGGRPETVLAVAAGVMERLGTDSLTFSMAAGSDGIEAFQSVAAGWSLSSELMAAVLDLEKTLAIFGRQNPDFKPDPESLARLDPAGRTRALFGLDGPYNLFVWRLDSI